MLMRAIFKYSRCSRAVSDFCRSRSATSLIEFGFALPLLLFLTFAGFETVRYINFTKQLTYLANSMATMIVERTTPVNGNGVIFAVNSALVTMPAMLSDPARNGAAWFNYLSLTLSSVVFTPTVAGCTSACTYTAKVAWTYGTISTRSCTVAPVAVPDTAPPSLTTLPQDVFNAGSVIVADVSYPYVPLVWGKFLPSITLTRSIYLQPRYMTAIAMVNTGGPFGICP
jgi:Flp pilus assembly protein TadG